MPFRKIRRPAGEIQLVSFMDMIFMLLIFYLVTSYVAQTSRKEKRFVFPTPRVELGAAEIFVQWLDARSVFWIDPASSGSIQRLLDATSYLAPEDQSRNAVSEMLRLSRLEGDAFPARLLALVGEADANPGRKYFVLLRCPDPLPYAVVMDAVAVLGRSRYANIEYGCVGGTVETLRMNVLEHTDAEGNLRKVIRIDFQGGGP
jgi:hypothetical protein